MGVAHWSNFTPACKIVHLVMHFYYYYYLYFLDFMFGRVNKDFPYIIKYLKLFLQGFSQGSSNLSEQK